jgi:hypothetical protein
MKTSDPPPPDPNALHLLTFPENLYVGQIVAEMLTMVCHQRLRGVDQEVCYKLQYELMSGFCHSCIPLTTSTLPLFIPVKIYL